MGPRRKISVAVVEYRQRQADEDEDTAPLNTPDNMTESGRVCGRHGDEEADTIAADLPLFKKKAAGRPKLVKQSSTDVTAAYHTVSHNKYIYPTWGLYIIATGWDLST